MRDFKVKVGRWTRKRRNAAGKLVTQKRFTVNFRCPDTGQKRRLSFPTKVQAESYFEIIVAQVAGERYFNPNTDPTVAEVVEHWIEARRGI